MLTQREINTLREAHNLLDRNDTAPQDTSLARKHLRRVIQEAQREAGPLPFAKGIGRNYLKATAARDGYHDGAMITVSEDMQGSTTMRLDDQGIRALRDWLSEVLAFIEGSSETD